jgi:hypothetical protein
MAGQLTIATLSDGVNSTSSTNCIKGSAKAWVNFNGTGGTIRSSYNVSSITVSATGQFLVNLTTAMADINYSVIASSSSSATNAALGANIMTGTPWSVLAPTTTQFGVVTPISTTAATALTYNCVAVFGN